MVYAMAPAYAKLLLRSTVRWRSLDAGRFYVFRADARQRVSEIDGGLAGALAVGAIGLVVIAARVYHQRVVHEHRIGGRIVEHATADCLRDAELGAPAVLDRLRERTVESGARTIHLRRIRARRQREVVAAEQAVLGEPDVRRVGDDDLVGARGRVGGVSGNS